MFTVLRTNFKLQAVKNCERPYRRYGSLLRTVRQVPLVGQATGNQQRAVDWHLIPSSSEANHQPKLPKMLLSKVAKELFSLLGGPRDMSTVLNPDSLMSKGFVERWELDFNPRWIDLKNQPPDTGIKDQTSWVPLLNCPPSDVDGVTPSSDGDSPIHPSLMKKPPSVSPLWGIQHQGGAHPGLLPSSLGDRKEESFLAKDPSYDGNESDHPAFSSLNNGEEISRSQEGMRGEGDEDSGKTSEQYQSTTKGKYVSESQEACSYPLDEVHQRVVGEVNAGKDSEGNIEEEKIFSRHVLESQEEMTAANHQEAATEEERLSEVEEEEPVSEQTPTLGLDVEDISDGCGFETPQFLEQDPKEMVGGAYNGQLASDQGVEQVNTEQKNRATSHTTSPLSEEEDSYEVACACCSSVIKPDGAWREELVEPNNTKHPELQELLMSSTEQEEMYQVKEAPIQEHRVDPSSPIASHDGAADPSDELDQATGKTEASPGPLEAQTDEQENAELSEVEEQNTFQDVMGRVQAMRENVSELSGDSEQQWVQALGLVQGAASKTQAPPSPCQPINAPKRKQSRLDDDEVFYKKPKRPSPACSSPGQGQSPRPPPSVPIPAECAFIPVLLESDLERVETARGKPIILGSGAYGDVHLMRRKSDGLLVALKRLKEVKNQLKAYQGMLSEIRPIVAMQNHNQFPKFIGIVDPTTFATEFIGDPATKTSINLVSAVSGLFNLTKLDWIRISLQISLGLQALHAAGWIHCDLHGGNIMVLHDPDSNRWSAKIIDLGSAVRIDSPPPLVHYNDQEKWFCRRLCPQIAPEIIDGFPMSIQTDIYSMGALLVSSKVAAQKDELAEIYGIGIKCAVDDPNARPSLPEIINELEALYQNVVESESPEQSLSSDSRSPKLA